MAFASDCVDPPEGQSSQVQVLFQVLALHSKERVEEKKTLRKFAIITRLHICHLASAQRKQRGHRDKGLPAATIDLWGSDPLMCFSVLLLIKLSACLCPNL